LLHFLRSRSSIWRSSEAAQCPQPSANALNGPNDRLGILDRTGAKRTFQKGINMLSQVLQGHTQDQLSDHNAHRFVEVSIEAACAVYWQSASDITKHYIALLYGQQEDSAHNGD